MRDNTVSNGLKEFGLDSYPGFDIDSSIVSKPDENQRANHDLADESLYEASGHDIVTVKLLENGALTTTMEPSSSEELSSTMELSSTIEPNSTMEPNSTGTSAVNGEQSDFFRNKCRHINGSSRKYE